MSYTLPPGDAVNFSWVGSPAYTLPAGDAVNFSWQDTPAPPGATIKHWNSTAFVTAPLIRWDGSAWVNPPASDFKRWSGSAWVQANP